MEGTRPTAAEWMAFAESSVAPTLIFIGSGLVSANRSACQELGRDLVELQEGRFAESLTAGSRTELLAAFGRPEPGKRIVVRRTCDSAPDDIFELRLQVLEDGAVVAVVLDVTESYRLDATLASLGDATTAINSDGRMAWRPFGNAGRFGVSDAEAIGVRVLEWIHPDELPQVLAWFNQVKAEPEARISAIVRMRHPYIRDGWMRSRITAVNRLDDPMLRAVIVRSEEASPIDLVEDIGETAGQYESIAEAMPVGVIMTDAQGNVVFLNELARTLLDLGNDAVGRTDWLAGLSSAMTTDVEALLESARRDRGRDTVVAALERPGGVRLWLRIDAVPQIDETGNVFGVIATLLDVTNETEARGELAQAQDRLWHLATHDPLTNLPNRMLILERIDEALKRSASGRASVALLYCDLDGFKQVNDAHGHAVGDVVLRTIARRLSGLVREDDVVGRFGGDEFLVLCEGFQDPSEVEGLVDRLVASVSQPLDIEGFSVAVGATIGVAYATGTAMRVDQLINEADDSMYAGKAVRDVSVPERRRR